MSGRSSCLCHNLLKSQEAEPEEQLGCVMVCVEGCSRAVRLNTASGRQGWLPWVAERLLVMVARPPVQVFHNLIGNSCKFTHNGYISVSAILKTDEVEVAVSDTGIGIPEDKYDQIFMAFEQVRRGPGGTVRPHSAGRVSLYYTVARAAPGQ